MDCYFRQLWVDKRLALNVSMPNISLNIKVLERLWYPDTIFLNGGKSFVHMVPMPNKFFRINKDGTVLYSQRYTITRHLPTTIGVWRAVLSIKLERKKWQSIGFFRILCKLIFFQIKKKSICIYYKPHHTSF